MSDPTIPPASPDPIPPVPPIDYATPATSSGLFAAPPVPAIRETDPNAKNWGMIAHLSGLAGYVIPGGNVIGPLVVWLVKKDEIPFVSDQAKEALNFHITVLIIALICAALICVFIGIILLPIVGIVALIFSIIGAVKASAGEYYRYPFAMRLIK